MKAAFNITPVSTQNNSTHLLVEAGNHGLSFLWFTKAPFSIKGLSVYNFSPADQLLEIKNIMADEQAFFPGLLSVTICYDFKESVLFPEKYNNADAGEEALSLMYGATAEVIYNNDLITSAHIYNHYRIPKAVDAIFSAQFFSANTFHSSSLQVEKFNHETALLYCIFFPNVLKTMLFKEGELQVLQQFNYITPEDVAYQLINICEQHNIKPAEQPLCLSGMIDEYSKLYIELSQYFLKISFEKTATEISIPEAMKQFPAHFFSHLTALALCVS